ncbi:ACT domain-containing protein [Acetivibrio mesophilus]|uniref:ACT domain-containing protein n=1 Tax=Acetivibrio mesophilus TaxID=2487273 RepID=A0A4Q0I892_9FIRM|nr:ACT domain-containing protein [Acetivibrio mesophilus]ODM25569.1 acetolactate synthase [Clostridium sp. Bc-iso-3]RXE60155.1 ACT domain-containing protein [Acetivibrio mesophilus]HHV29087.1 ACT domain-containing protein [Clostridium sp.]
MLVKQISVFLENKSGRLAEVTKILADSNIDISALSIADTTDFGILRLIVNDPETAEKALKDNGFTVSCCSVIAISVPDKPGGLAKALSVLESEAIGIEYMYAFVGKAENEALVILRLDNPEKAVDMLEGAGVKVLTSDTVCKL